MEFFSGVVGVAFFQGVQRFPQRKNVVFNVVISANLWFLAGC
jgi:hypothetical protein